MKWRISALYVKAMSVMATVAAFFIAASYKWH